MSKQGKTEAESCWDDDSIDTDEKCEQYLRKHQRPAAEVDDADDDEDDDEDTDDDAEDEVAVGEEEESDAENNEVTASGTDAETDDSEEAPEDGSVEEASTPRGKKMARKKADGSKTKAEHIREVIAAKQAAGAELRPRDIIAALEKKGVEVNASQVSITLRSMGIPPARKGGGAGRPKTKPVAHAEPEAAEKSRQTLKRKAVVPAEVDGDLSEHVGAAADFIHAVGGYVRATKLLDLCNKVLQRG